MKANYPGEYMTAVLTADSGDIEKVAEIINECKKMNLPVLPPDINESFGGFTLIKSKRKGGKDQIRFGLYTIKNLGSDISDAIIDERQKNGKFTSFSEFLERINHRNLNKKSLEALIKSGAMDKLGERGQMLANMEEALSYHKEHTDGPANQDSLFADLKDQSSIASLRLKDAQPATMNEKLSWERELLGLYISGHPLDAHKDKLKGSETSIVKIKKLREGMTAVISGIVADTRAIITKRGEHMAFLKIADYDDAIDTVAFPRIFKEHKELFETKEQCIKIKGRISERNGEKSLIIEAVKPL